MRWDVNCKSGLQEFLLATMSLTSPADLTWQNWSLKALVESLSIGTNFQSRFRKYRSDEWGDGWAGSYFPRCSVKKKGVLPIWHVQKFFSSEGIDSWHVLSSCEKRLFRIRRRCKTNFWWRFFDDWVFADKERSAKESQAMFLRVVDMDIYIYVCIYIVLHDMLLYDSDKATG